MPDGRTTVLFIAGSGRSGSTLLDNILGQVDGYFSAGEVRYLWERGLLENRLCGCGARFRECALWTSVLEQAFGGVDAVPARAAMEQQRRSSRIRHLPRLLLSKWRPGPLTSKLGIHRDRLASLYRAIGTVTGSRVIVDSSKLPAYGQLLAMVPEIDLRVVHLVRDPRATAYSWARRKAQPDRAAPGFMEPQRPGKSGALWTIWNATVEILWRGFPERYLRLRYEDLCARPRDCVTQVLAMLGDGEEALPFVDDFTVLLTPNHTVSGNPNRLQSGEVRLRADVEWMQGLPGRTHALVTLLTAPMLLRYGYPLRRTPPVTAA